MLENTINASITPCRGSGEKKSNYNSKMESLQSYTASLQLEYMLGNNNQYTATSHAFVCNSEELVCYGKNIFTKYNIVTKETKQILQQVDDVALSIKGKVLRSKYFPCRSNNVMMVLKKCQHIHFISLLWVDRSATSLIKISHQKTVECVNFSYHAKKNLLYLLLNDTSAPKSQQFLKVLEIQPPNPHEDPASNPTQRRNKVIMNVLIKKTGGVTEDLTDIIVSSDQKQLYLLGKDYFRQWFLFFNDKSAKQSNYRNIQRNLKNEIVINFFWVKDSDVGKTYQPQNQNVQQCQCPNYLVLITTKKLLVIKRNQLLKKIQIPIENPFFRVEQEPAEIALEKSLNQIYKTKFRMFTEKEEEQEQNQNMKRRKQFISKKQASQSQITQVCAVSQAWVVTDAEGNKQIKFLGILKNDKIFVYKFVNDLQVKIESEMNSNQDMESTPFLFSSGIKWISVSKDGNVILINDEANHLYLFSQQKQEDVSEFSPLYGLGHPHNSSIASISTPELSMLMVTVSEQGSIKIWNYAHDQKKMIIDNTPKVKPVSAIIHPCGFMVIVNFGLEIKIYGIVSSQFTELVGIKTSDICLELYFSRSGHTLISNQKTMIKFYEPFTLRCTGKIQSEDMRLQIVKSVVSENGEYIIFQTCDYNVYRRSFNSIFPSCADKMKVEDGFQNDQVSDTKNKNNLFCHKQIEEYTCLYFDFGFLRNNMNSMIEGKGEDLALLDKQNIFVGFTQSKYMVVYANFGQELVAEFPIQDCYVTSVLVKGNLMFLGTSIGSIRIYHWPIKENHCEISFFAEEKGKAFLKPPRCLKQFQVWIDYTPITCLHLLPNSNRLAAGSKDGFIGFISYKLYKNGNEIYEKQDSQNYNERKRMIKAMNNIKLMKVSEIDRINKLIEKTETDIEKIDFQIKNQKVRKNQTIQKEQEQYENTLLKRRNAYMEDCEKSYDKIAKEIKNLQQILELKKIQVVKIIQDKKKVFEERKNYQTQKIEEVKNEQLLLKKQQRQNILSLIQEHKENIRKTKQDNLKQIFKLQKQFEDFVNKNFIEPQSVVEMDGIQVDEDILNQEIWLRVIKVQELKNDIASKQKILDQAMERASSMKEEDEQLQEIFEDNLDIYNNRRESNLILHSQLLKMQNQLLERQQILSKKDELIMMAYQQKQANLTFKDFVKGNVTKLEDDKEKAINQFLGKQEEFHMIFQELNEQIKKGQVKKLQLSRVDEKINFFESEKKAHQANIKILMKKIQEFKKFLLLQGVSQDSEQKKIYQDQEKLLAEIRWLEKRFAMACINETKLVALKKSGMRQVIQQNKNLLEECNQLREEDLQYDKQINNLKQKLGEANKIIEFERKVRSQNQSITSQSQKLDLIRKMFKDHIEDAKKGIQQEQQVQYPF